MARTPFSRPARNSGGLVVLSGLPASGKSRLGAAIAPLLGLPLLDKDDFLVALFQRDGIGDAAWRERLSRKSDDRLRDAATGQESAVLVSFWRHPGREDGGGTLTDWLHPLPGTLIEVHCHCPAAVAFERFNTRSRHAGHLDAARDKEAMREKFEDYAARGPLGLGTVLIVDTTVSPDIPALVARIQRAQLGRD